MGGDEVETNFASDGSNVYFLTYDKRLYALDYQTGDVSWDVTVEDIGRLPQVAVADGRVFLAGGLIVAVEADSGQREWTFHPGEMSATRSLLPVGRAAASGGPQASAPAVADGYIFVKTGETRQGVALEVESGRLQWSVETDRWFQPSVVAGDSVYVASGNVIEEYELSSGDSTGWIFETIADVGSFVVVDGVVFATGGRGFLQALTGE